MASFSRDNTALTASFPEQFKEEFMPLCAVVSNERFVGSVADTILGEDCVVNQPKMNKYKLATLEQHSRVETQLLLSTLLSLSAPPTVNCVF